MAEAGRDVQVHGTGAVEGTVAKGGNNPEAIVQQIERTREDLARTIDDLAERVSPAGNVRLLREKLAEQVARPEVQLGAAAVGLATVGLFVLRTWMRHRQRRG